MEGAAEVCRAAGVALVGGETAEMPDVYRDGELDFAGTCVGIVRAEDVVDGSGVEAGDVVVGLPSDGVHANGFTLVRRVLEDEDYDGGDLLAGSDELRLAELHLRADDPAAKAGALAELLDLQASSGTIEIGDTVVRFVPGGPQGRPELHAELFV